MYLWSRHQVLWHAGQKVKGARLPEPSDIVKFIVDFFESENAGINELKNTNVKRI